MKNPRTEPKSLIPATAILNSIRLSSPQSFNNIVPVGDELIYSKLT